jgi:phosphatidylserine/phosphatidylglycerophosphate/cardiolipin synthase-like enzyme
VRGEYQNLVEAPEASEGKLAYDTVKALCQKVAQRAAVYIWSADKRSQDGSDRHGSLHVKCAVVDAQLLFISSANLTAYALTLKWS